MKIFTLLIVVVAFTVFLVDFGKALIYFTAAIYFLPQILRNASHGFKKTFDIKVILALSLSRLLIVFYFFTGLSTIVSVPADPWLLTIVSVLIGGQGVVLFIQIRNPKFFVPKALRSHEYDYFRSLEEESAIDEIPDCNI
jgi:hypothetical protein